MSVTGAVGTNELVIIGAGGFGAIAVSVADKINAMALEKNCPPPWDVIGYADSNVAKRGTIYAGYKVHGTLGDLDRDFHGHALWFFCAIGENHARAKVAVSAEESGWKPATLMDPTAILAANVEIGAGSYIGPVSVISVNTKIGACSIVDMHVSIGHDVEVGDFCAIYPGARISGGSRVGMHAVVGSNATLLPGTVVGDRAVVGAGSLASGVIDPDTTVLGVPAQIVYRRTGLLSH